MALQKISNLTNYTTPIDVDIFPLVDITTTTTKKVTWANIKATLKTYNDTFYIQATQTVTLTNKKLASSTVDSTSSFVDSVDNTKAFNFVIGGTTGITGHFATNFTTAKTITFPDITDTLVGKTTTDLFTNKSLSDSTCFFVNNADNTKKLNISVIGTTGITGTLRSNFTTAKTLDLPDATDTLVGKATTDTLTNKRITKRVTTITSSATPTPAGDTSDMFTVTALAVGATFAAPTGTPTDGQLLLIRILDNGSSQTLAWNAIYRAVSAVPLPSATTISTTLYLIFTYNAADSKWDLLATR